MDDIEQQLKRFTNNVVLISGVESELKECDCKTPGLDDGDRTCWQHHDCLDGSCTHQDDDDEPDIVDEDYLND